jgi:fructose-bisphosphate aldolase class I
MMRPWVTVNNEQLDRMQSGDGFMAALDQSGGSTPSMLAAYGISQTAYSGDAEMFDLVHQMRTRILCSPAFDANQILGTILFQNTVDRTVDGLESAQYIWKVKGIVPFLKIDLGLEPETNGAQIMKPIPELAPRLTRALESGVFGTKMRSFIKQPDEAGITAVTTQQFDLALQILSLGLMPILEPEIDIHSPGKADAEVLLKSALLAGLDRVPSGAKVMLKLTLPEQDDFYLDLVNDGRVLRVLALSGGYTRDEADARLARNQGVIASFSRAFLQGLSVDQSQAAFDSTLRRSVEQIYEASVT